MPPKPAKKQQAAAEAPAAAAAAANKKAAPAKKSSETSTTTATPPNGHHDETTDLPPSTTDDEQSPLHHNKDASGGERHGNNKRMVTTEAEGILPDGSRFHMPATISVMRSLIIPRCYSLVSTQVWILLCLLTNPISLYLYYAYGPTDAVMAFYTCQFVFWRLAYNVGIGLILHCQSNGKRFEAWVIRSVLKSRIGRAILERCVAFRDGRVKPFKVADYPQPFSAWMLFRFIVNVILACDLLSYFVLVYVHWAPPEFVTASGALNPVDIGLYVVGVGLIVFAIWSKSDAHRVIGDYAWYWGDFFFLLDQELTFDGIFEMFPHPMYTVGYAFMYGFSLMAKSHTVFYWSVFGHICQMVFLTAVENPHIDKTYNSAYMPSEEEARREAILYDDERGYFEKKELVVLKNFRFFRASDLVVLVCLAYSALAWMLSRGWTFSFLTCTIPQSGIFTASDPWPLRILQWILEELNRPGSWFAVGQYAFWRLLLLGGLGWALRQQSLSGRWTKEFGNARRAFDSWKVLYNTCVTTTNFCFILCAIQLGEWGTLFTTGVEEWRLTMAVIGLLLVGINMWASLGVYEAVGDFGYFYGDFFIEDVPRRLAYSGVYRYLNNPDTVLGCAWFYGLALLAGSPAVTALAILSHLCVKLFERTVEAPHMQRKYGAMMRKEGGARRAIKERTKSVRSAIEERRRRARVDYERAVARLKQEVERRREAYENLSSRILSSPTRDRPAATSGAAAASGTPSGSAGGRRRSPPQNQFPEFPPTTADASTAAAAAAPAAAAAAGATRRQSRQGKQSPTSATKGSPTA